MNDRIDWKYQFSDRRARVYLLWSVLATAGFVATHFYQRQSINLLWLIISILGLGYMAMTMSLKDNRMRAIFTVWLITIGLGMVISMVGFHTSTPLLAKIMSHLGGFWLLLLGYGYFFNGLVDRPSTWYWFAAIINIVGGLACFFIPAVTDHQYLVAAIISAWSMLNLWIFRSSDQ